MQEKKRVTLFFLTELAVITALMIMGLIVPVLNLGALALCAWMIIFERSVDEIVDLVFYILPLSPIFKLDLDGFALYNFVLLLFLLRLLLITGFSFHFPSILPVVFILYLCAGLKNANLSELIRMVCQFLIVIDLLCVPAIRRGLSIKRKNTMMSVGLILSSVLSLMRHMFPRLDRYLGVGDNIKLGPMQYFTRFQGIELNCNMYTVLLSISLAVFMVYFVVGRLSKLDYVMVAVLTIFGMMTVSMSFILSLGAALALAVAATLRYHPEKTGVIVMLGIISVMAVTILFGTNDTVSTVLFRLEGFSSESASIDSVTTGRWHIWMAYLEYFLENPTVMLFGKGFGARIVLARPSHNYYLETIYFLGLVGGGLYAFSLFSIFAPSHLVKRRISLYQQLPLIMLLARGMARNLIGEEKLMFIYLIYTLTALDTFQEKARADRPLRRGKEAKSPEKRKEEERS